MDRPPRTGSVAGLALLQQLHFFLEFGLQRLEVEARARLHGRELDEALGRPGEFLLHIREAPELIHEPVLVKHRVLYPGSFEGVEAQIGEDRPVHLDGAAKPAIRLIEEAILEVVDADGSERGLREIEDLVPLGWPLACEQVQLVVAVEMNLIRGAVQFLTLLEFIGNARVAGSR